MKNAVTRRTLLKGAALGTVAMGAAANVALADAAGAEVSWDAEYDVVVVGLGGAGCAAAISAADAGA